MYQKILLLLLAAIGAAFGVYLPPMVMAHCDTMDGPVVKDAKLALEKGDITPVLKWVQPKNEKDIREAFAMTLAVRNKGPEARDLADKYFFETLVRVHRAGEGEPYTGLKPAGEVEPGIAAADAALDSGQIDPVVKEMSAVVADGIREQYLRASELKKHAGDSVEAGREYVEAYVTFIHYVEKLHDDAAATGDHHGEAPATEVKHHH